MPRRLLLPVLPLLLVLAGCSGDTDDGDDLPRADVGEVIPAKLGSSIEGRHSHVVLPGRRFDFTVSSPRASIDSISAREAGVSAEAGEGRRFVEIAWERGVVPGDTFVMAVPEDVEPMLTLTADGEQHPVGSLVSEGPNAAIVVVPEDVDDVGLEIEFDGLTQVIEDVYSPVDTRGDGPRSLYLDAASQRWAYCPETALSAGEPEVTFFGADCQASISSAVPYVGPLGWAPAGRAWVVVRFRAGSPDASYDAPGGYVAYDVQPSEVRLRLAGVPGAEPRLFAEEEGDDVGAQDDGSWKARAVFSVPETTDQPRLTFRRVLVALPEDRAEAAGVGAPIPLRRVHAGEL
ncbi:hypothetical protein [Nocardioides lijunqiniae]|uniref:hypothetical protein n=1 Tax=Nocardioides lijunqiniae TaxID=2760832 RepID=UPI001878AE21|nr:hypothetical protein [Nocardioides lijunqiniae]